MTDGDFTVGDLRRHLQGWRDDTKLTFGGGLTFYRIKNWDDNEVYIEFGEAQAYLDPAFKKRNPHIQVAFINPNATSWDEEGLVGKADVSIR